MAGKFITTDMIEITENVRINTFEDASDILNCLPSGTILAPLSSAFSPALPSPLVNDTAILVLCNPDLFERLTEMVNRDKE